MKKLDRSKESLEKIFSVIKEIHKRNPDFRFGQIIHNENSYFMENEDYYQYLLKFLALLG